MDHPIDTAAAAVGSQAALADALGVTRGAVNQWKLLHRVVPLEHCTAIEKVSGGAVMRWDLRPNDWHHVWPELIGQKGAPKVPRATATRGA